MLQLYPSASTISWLLHESEVELRMSAITRILYEHIRDITGFYPTNYGNTSATRPCHGNAFLVNDIIRLATNHIRGLVQSQSCSFKFEFQRGHCKSWTLDSGLDHGLDCGLDYGLRFGQKRCVVTIASLSGQPSNHEQSMVQARIRLLTVLSKKTSYEQPGYVQSKEGYNNVDDYKFLNVQHVQ